MTAHRMDEGVKAQWVAALRSGKYHQGQETLRSAETGSYCCLGVLCDLMGVTWERFGSCYIAHDGEYSTGGGLPLTLRRKVGLPGAVEGDLIDLNDVQQWDFDQIADHIDREL